jgi:cobalt/nickel transport system permease protein
MLAGLFALPPLWAVHLPDGLLSRTWTLAGFAGLALLLLLGAWRIREDEVPRVAILSAAFFVASLVHVPLPGAPPTHLLLNGLLGVVLGPRAALAIPLGLFLQAVFFSHGGLSALGVNSCVMTLPALASWLVFACLCRFPWSRHPAFRFALVAASTAVFLLSLTYAIALLFTNHLTESDTLETARANALLLYPITLIAVATLSILAGWLERRLENAPEFPLGLIVGEFAVLLTLLCVSVVLLFGTQADYHVQVFLVCILHLPLAVVEGVVLGFTVGFLARVKPEMLSGWRPNPESASEPAAAVRPRSPSALRVPALLLILGCALLIPSPASAHGFNADYRVDRARQKVDVEGWFTNTDNRPRNASVRVFRADGSVLVEGKLDAEGAYTFHYETAEPLRVVVDASLGHVKELKIPAQALAPVADTIKPEAGAAPDAVQPAPEPFAPRDTSLPLKDILAGVGFLLALAAFVMSLFNARRLRQLTSQPGTRPPATPPTDPGPG